MDRLSACVRSSVLACAVTLAACSSDPEIRYAPYTGDAYPHRLPVIPTAKTETAYVTNSLSDTVSVLDLDTGAVLATVPVGRDPVDIDGPHHIAIDSARGLAYVALSYPLQSATFGPHASHGASSRAGYVQKLALADFRVLGEMRAEENPGDIVLSDDGNRLIVTHFDLKRAQSSDPAADKRAALLAYDPARIAPDGPSPARVPSCVAPHGVALSKPDGRTAYVACYGQDAIAVVDLAAPTNAPVLVPLAGAGVAGQPVHGPYSIIFAPSGGLAAVGNIESKEVHLFDSTTRTFVPPIIRVQGAPFFATWSADGSRLYVPTQDPDSVYIIDPKTGATLQRVSFTPEQCRRPHELELSRDESKLLVVCEGTRKDPSVIVELDPATLTYRRSYPVGVYPDRLFIVRSPR